MRTKEEESIRQILEEFETLGFMALEKGDSQLLELIHTQSRKALEEMGTSSGDIVYTMKGPLHLSLRGEALEILEQMNAKLAPSVSMHITGLLGSESDEEPDLFDVEEENEEKEVKEEKEEKFAENNRTGTPASKCTIGLLAFSAQAIYRVKQDNFIDITNDDYHQTLVELSNHGYAIYNPITPVRLGGTGLTGLGAVTIEPQDNMSPVIISFRGTKGIPDVRSDLRLGVTGVVQQPYRDAAFEYYQAVRADPRYKDRQIILTGHSLGGHLAQYVASKAYATDAALRESPTLQVRTFNTAPVGTDHSAVFDKYPKLQGQLMNYRMNADWVSQLPVKKYLGQTFNFLGKRGALKGVKNHSLGVIHEFIPEDVKAQVVGASYNQSMFQGKLIETVNGTLNSYRCRIAGQYYSQNREGKKNLALMETVFPLIVADIKVKNYQSAIDRLIECRAQIEGIQSIATVDLLLKNLGKEGLLQYRLANMRKIIETGSLGQGDTLTNEEKARVLFKYCELEPDVERVVTMMSNDNNADLMLNHFKYMTTENLDRSKFMIETLMKHEFDSLETKGELRREASVLKRATRNIGDKITGKAPETQQNILKQLLTEDKQFVSEAQATALLETSRKAFLNKSGGKVINLIEAVIAVKKAEAAMSPEQAAEASENFNISDNEEPSEIETMSLSEFLESKEESKKEPAAEVSEGPQTDPDAPDPDAPEADGGNTVRFHH